MYYLFIQLDIVIKPNRACEIERWGWVVRSLNLHSRNSVDNVWNQTIRKHQSVHVAYMKRNSCQRKPVGRVKPCCLWRGATYEWEAGFRFSVYISVILEVLITHMYHSIIEITFILSDLGNEKYLILVRMIYIYRSGIHFFSQEDRWYSWLRSHGWG